VKYALLALLCIGCGGYPIHTEAEVPDAAPDVAETSTPHNPGSLCCTGPTNPVWGNVWQCDQEGGAPWICGLDDGGVVFACDDPRCNVGDWCQGITGYGTVGLCPDD
jgi:hypothetical protein